jgi:hypothetical protein
MVAKEVCVNYYNFNPIWVQHASIHVVLVLKSKKLSYKIYSEPEPKEIFAATQSQSRIRSRKKYFRLRNTVCNSILVQTLGVLSSFTTRKVPVVTLNVR